MLNHGKTLMGLALFSLFTATGVATAEDAVTIPEPAPVVQENNWEKFKESARQAGGAIAGGTRNTARKVGDGAEKVGDAIVDGSKKAGHAIAEGYEESKEYVQKKLD